MKRSILSRLDLPDERLEELQDQLQQKREQARRRTEEVVEDLQNRSSDIADRSSKIAGRLKDNSLTTGYELGANTLTTAAALLDDAGIENGADSLRRRAEDLQEAGRAVERPPIEDYDELNVHEVNDALEGLSSYQLEKVRRYEQAHKDRVTVLREVDRRLG